MSNLKIDEKRKRLNKDITFMGKNSIRNDQWAALLEENTDNIEPTTPAKTNNTLK